MACFHVWCGFDGRYCEQCTPKATGRAGDDARDTLIQTLKAVGGIHNPDANAPVIADAILAALALPAPVVEGASLERALLVFAACARDLGPDVPDDEWAKFRLLASDYRRAHAAYVSLTGTEPPFPEDAHAALSEGRSHG